MCSLQGPGLKLEAAPAAKSARLCLCACVCVCVCLAVLEYLHYHFSLKPTQTLNRTAVASQRMFTGKGLAMFEH